MDELETGDCVVAEPRTQGVTTIQTCQDESSVSELEKACMSKLLVDYLTLKDSKNLFQVVGLVLRTELKDLRFGLIELEEIM